MTQRYAHSRRYFCYAYGRTIILLRGFGPGFEQSGRGHLIHQPRSLSEAEIGQSEEVDDRSVEVISAFSLGSLRRNTGPIIGPIVGSRVLAFECANTGSKTDQRTPQGFTAVSAPHRTSSLQAILPSCIFALVHKRRRKIASAAVHTSSRLIGDACALQGLIKGARELLIINYTVSHTMVTFTCETCRLELSSKHALEAHINRKYKCVPPGQVQHECRTCDKQFTRKNLLDQHLRTDKHRQVVAAVEALEGTGSTSIVTSESHNRSSPVVDSHPKTNDITRAHEVQIRPRSFGKATVGHLVRLTYEELREALDLREKCGLTSFLKLFKLLHLNPEAPRNHNVIVDITDGEPAAFAFKQHHWREVDYDGMVRDCVNNAVISFLDIETFWRCECQRRAFQS